MSINAGRLRTRVTIQRATLTQDEFRQPVEGWSDVATAVNAEVIPASGGETIRGRQVEAQIVSVVTIRYRSGLSPKMRIVHDGRNLFIDKILDPDGLKKILELHCKEDQF